MRGEEQTLATRRRRSAVPPPSLGDVLNDALARAQTASPARAKKGGKSCPVSRVASGLFAGSEFDNNCSSIVGGAAASQAASNNCSSSTVVGRAAAAEAVPPSHPLLGDGIKADDLLIEMASWLTTAEFVARERRLRRACLRRAVYVVVACNRLERAVAERNASNNCSSTAVGGAAAAEAVPPSHPLLGDGIEADDLLIEIASWLTAAECRALAACRLRFHALASWTG